MAAFNSVLQGSSVGPYPSHGNETRGDASSHATRKANEMKARSVEHDADMESHLYELWQFIPVTRRDGGKRWDLARGKFIPSDQATLEDLVKAMEEEIPVKEQYKCLTQNKQKLINDLVAAHNQRDRSYKWNYVYINTETSRLSSYVGLSQEVTTRMEVIILRELQHQSRTAEKTSKPSAAGHASSHNSGNGNGLNGGQPAFDGMGRQANHLHIIDNGPGLSRAPENGGLPVNAGVPTMHPQTHPQAQSPADIYEHPSVHTQTNPPIHSHGLRHNPSAPQQHGHAPVYLQMQNSMPHETNYAMPQGVQIPATQDQGMHRGQATNNHGQKFPQIPNNVPPMAGNINSRGGPFARSGDETRHPAHRASASIYTCNDHEEQPQNTRFATADLPQRERKKNATALPPKVFQQDRRTTHLQEDSSVMTDDESLFEEGGYISSVSSTGSVAKGSLHREKRYMHRDMSNRGYRRHYRKQNQTSQTHTSYPGGKVDIIPSASTPRTRESRRYRDTSRTSNRPVAVHESKSDFQAPGLAELSLSANEASYRLKKVEEMQQVMIDQLSRLELSSHKPDSRDYVGRGVAVRGIEHDIPVLGGPVYYYPERLIYSRRLGI